MNAQRRLFSLLESLLFLVLLSFAPTILAQNTETEPNNHCTTANEFAQPVTSTFVVDGKLGTNDVDYYQFHATPGEQIQVDLQQGTLPDPFLGFLDGNCTPLAYNDDFQGSSNARLVLTVPANGILILAATAFDDLGFNGAHRFTGTYQLILSPPVVPIGSISGRIVDAGTQQPLPSWAWVDLYYCPQPADPGSCYYVMNTGTADDRTFSFSTDWNGQPLPAGTYYVIANGDGYQSNQPDLFAVGRDEHFSVGDIALTPNPSIGSISGRVVDAFTGIGLSGQEYPYANVSLSRCDGGGCTWINGFNVEGDGSFRFTNNYPGQLPPGDYVVDVYAQNYQQLQQAVPGVAIGEDRDVGKLSLQPNAIQFSEVRPCGNLPKEGGSCRYSVRVTNRSGKWLSGAAWSLVGSGTASPVGWTSFQTANPVKVSLKPGASRVVEFYFYVPRSVGDGTTICADGWFGENSSQPYFNTLGMRNLLCIGKGVTGFSQLSKQDAQAVSRELQRPEKWHDGKKGHKWRPSSKHR